jgi:hydroxypyruvate isomerase
MTRSKDDTEKTLDRRQLMATASLAGASLMAGLPAPAAAAELRNMIENGRIRQSVCRWCYSRTPLEELCVAAKQIGLQSIEILDPEDFDTLKKHGLSCAMVNSHSIPKGLNDPANHDFCLDRIRTSIEAASAAGFPNVITFSGNRNGMPDDVGLDHCVKALKQVVGYAEKKNVTVMMEMLNSKVDHADYMGDNTPWGFELVERVGSERFKILYDIYHMQIMEGDVIRTIQDHHDKIGHYHTAGNPGRHEIDETQELFYPAIVRAILDTGYKGFLGQEFIPRSGEPLESLAAGVRICDV